MSKLLPPYDASPLNFYRVLKTLTPDQLKAEWEEVDEKHYEEMGEVLPPIRHRDRAFMVGEVMTHTDYGAIYQAFVTIQTGSARRYFTRPAYLHTFNPQAYRDEIAHQFGL